MKEMERTRRGIRGGKDWKERKTCNEKQEEGEIGQSEGKRYNRDVQI